MIFLSIISKLNLYCLYIYILLSILVITNYLFSIEYYFNSKLENFFQQCYYLKNTCSYLDCHIIIVANQSMRFFFFFNYEYFVVNNSFKSCVLIGEY